MRIPGPRTWRVRLLLARILLAIAGRVITHFHQRACPGKTYRTQERGCWSGQRAVALAQARQNLRSKPIGRPNLGRGSSLWPWQPPGA